MQQDLTTNTVKEQNILTMSVRAVPLPLLNPGKVYTQNIGRRRASAMWEATEWDLAETGRIIDVEGFYRRALRTKQDLFLKEGYEFNGPNLIRNDYIKKRLAQMEAATDIPFPILLSNTIASLERTSNAFWVKVRNYKASGGRMRFIGKKEIEPVAGYFLLPPESIVIKRDEYGRVIKYRQQVYGKKPVDFNPEDIVHFYFDRREGFSVGTPSVVPVKADIRALRRIEEDVELLLYQHLFPLFHYKVGTEKAPAKITSEGEDEVKAVQLKVAQMPSDGAWVTSERHEIKAIDSPQPPLAVEKVIDQFKHRIYVGLGVSPIDMGETSTGASRAVAQQLSRPLVNSTKQYQKEFGAFFFHFIIIELLLESKFSPETLFNEENLVFLRFKEIDQETRIAKENHLADQFLKNMIKHSEYRIESGRQPFVGNGWPTGTTKAKMFKQGDGDWKETNYGVIERDKIILQSLDEPGTPASQAETKSRTATNKSKSAGGNSVSNKNQPKNQHGTRSSAKLNKDFQDVSYPKELDVLYKQIAPVSSSYDSIKKDTINRILVKGIEMKIIDFNLRVVFPDAAKKLILLAKQAFRIGLNKANVSPWATNLSYYDGEIQAHIEKYVRKLQDDLIRYIDMYTTKDISMKEEDAVFTSMIFNGLQYRSNFIDNTEIMKAYNYGSLIGLRLSGVSEIESEYHGDGDCEVCKNASLQTYNVNGIIYSELWPHHPKCCCTVKAKG